MHSWRDIGKKLVLASQSPRRKQILHLMGMSFDVRIPANIDEQKILASHGGSIEEALTALAVEKARSVGPAENECALGADTIVFHDGAVLGKPEGVSEAIAMITGLSGGGHRVYSGVALVSGTQTIAAQCACTEVYFRNLDEDEVETYIAGGEWKDKAGGYGIQGSAMAFVEKINGCFYNVMGLPVMATITLFKHYHAARKER